MSKPKKRIFDLDQIINLDPKKLDDKEWGPWDSTKLSLLVVIKDLAREVKDLKRNIK